VEGYYVNKTEEIAEESEKNETNPTGEKSQTGAETIGQERSAARAAASVISGAHGYGGSKVPGSRNYNPAGQSVDTSASESEVEDDHEIETPDTEEFDRMSIGPDFEISFTSPAQANDQLAIKRIAYIVELDELVFWRNGSYIPMTRGISPIPDEVRDSAVDILTSETSVGGRSVVYITNKVTDESFSFSLTTREEAYPENGRKTSVASRRIKRYLDDKEETSL